MISEAQSQEVLANTCNIFIERGCHTIYNRNQVYPYTYDWGTYLDGTQGKHEILVLKVHSIK